LAREVVPDSLVTPRDPRGVDPVRESAFFPRPLSLVPRLPSFTPLR
jgi:hypothetical protein